LNKFEDKGKNIVRFVTSDCFDFIPINKIQMTLSIETPALLFSATTLILLAYTNRFLTIAQLIRELKKTYKKEENKNILLEIKNLNLRLTLIRYMQLMGVLCLFLSVLAMLVLFLEMNHFGIYLFASSIFCLLLSLGISFWEISISVNALRLHLQDLVEE
jgi:cell division protein FtsL